MQAIRVWLSALVALFLVVSMLVVPLIQMEEGAGRPR